MRQGMAPVLERLADRVTAFTGRPRFVTIHEFWFVAWMLLNCRAIVSVAVFDVYQTAGIPCACSPNRRFSDNGTALPGTLKTLGFSRQVAFVPPDSYPRGFAGCGTLAVSPAVDAPAILSYLS